MSFNVGQTVIHPHHGTAVIDRKERREVRGVSAEFLVLEAPATDLTLLIPIDGCEEAGLRDPMCKQGVKDVLAVLGDAPSSKKGHWSRRLKTNQQRLRSGDPKQVAMVLRDLAHQEVDKNLSPAEKRLKMQASIMLTSEIGTHYKGGVKKAEQLVTKALDLPVEGAADDAA